MQDGAGCDARSSAAQNCRSVLGMAQPEVYQFRVALQRISPKIWRRVQLLSSQSLADLHFAIQLSMGWTDEFQHQFLIRNHRLGIGRPGGHVLFGNVSDDGTTSSRP